MQRHLPDSCPSQPQGHGFIAANSDGESSAAVRSRVIAARERQLARQGKANALLAPRETERYCACEPAAGQLLSHAITRLNLSARAYHRVLRVARSIADLAGADVIASPHVAEAIQYRRLDASF